MTDPNSPLLQTVWWNQTRNRVEVKSSVWTEPELWTPHESDDTQQGTYYTSVPWLARAIEMRANAVASVPFRIMRGETEIDKSEQWADKLGYWPDPWRLLWLVEAALCFGPAYVWREYNRATTKALRYVAPSTIAAKIDSVQGLTGFERNIGTRRIQATPDDLLYFWKPDYTVEIGPPTVTPAGAALAAAGVLYNVDQFAAQFFKRGAIKATLLTVDGAPQKDQVNELKRWWQKAVSGIGNAFAANVINAAVKPVVIGDGMQELQDNNLTASKREDIATAIGVPQTLLFSTGAGGLGGGGVVGQDDKHFYSKTVVPECLFIQGVFNSQLFSRYGLRMEFQPETLEVFQEDEQMRATAFATYVKDGGLPKSLVAEMLGLDLPDGWEYADLDPQEQAPEPVAPPSSAPSEPATPESPGEDVNAQVDAIVAGLTKAAVDDLRAWRRKSQKRGKLADFQSNVIPFDLMVAIESKANNGWLEAMDEAIAGIKDDAPDAELTTFERVAAEYAKAADVFAQVLNGNGNGTH